MLNGIDVSGYQGNINWKSVRSDNVEFAIAKATEYPGYPDATFRYNWSGMKNNGIVRGAYHFFHPSIDPKAQVQSFHQTVHDAGGFKLGDFAVLDVEVTDGEPPLVTANNVAQFIRKYLHDVEHQICIYTGAWFWDTYVWLEADPIIFKCPLWAASWTASGKPDTTLVPKPFAKWPIVSFWQYSSTGRVPGINSAVDLDVFMGTMNQLKRVVSKPKY